VLHDMGLHAVVRTWHGTTRCSVLHGRGLHAVVCYVALDYTL